MTNGFWGHGLSVLKLLTFLTFLGLSKKNVAAPIPLGTMISLKAAPANIRTGPGKIYPIVWILMKSGMPLKITKVFDMWYKIQDPLGSEGWLHKSLISRKRNVMVMRPGTLLSAPQKTGKRIATVQSGALLEHLGHQGPWLLVKSKTSRLKGYILRHDCWQGFSY